MDLDDVIYSALLIICICIGVYYRKIQDKQQKKWIGTSIGLLVVVLVSGFDTWHPLLTFLVNAIIILLVSKRYCHIVSFVFTFSYLLFFRTTLYFGISYPPAHTNLIQMMLTLKMVGLAFEVNNSYLSKITKEEQSGEKSNGTEDIDPSFINIFHYAFNYIGVLTGPYYRYKTFDDYFNLPFSQYINCNEETLKKLAFIPLYSLLFVLGTYNWPFSYALSDEFYNERSWLYRFWYVWPVFFNFRMRIYIGLVLSECVCTMAGLGAYPLITEPKSGLGPSKNFQELNEISKHSSKLINEKYDFETIHNINPYGADFCTTFRDGMKHWNICIQYWLAANVYKRFPNKKYRTHATLLVSAFWHGMYLGHYICIGLVPFYLPIEDVYVKLVLKDNSGISLKIWEWIIWFFKMQTFSYLGIAFHLLTLPNVFYYYNSIYYCGFIFALVMYVLGISMLKSTYVKLKQSGKAFKKGEDKQLSVD